MEVISFTTNILIHAELPDLKKLSQSDRKICMKALDSFLEGRKEDFALNRFKEIESVLYSKPKRQQCMIHFIVAIAKRILNLFGRIGSRKLYLKVEQVKTTILQNQFSEYLKSNCDIQSNCNLDEAEIYFLGDNHADPVQPRIRKILMEHFASQEKDQNVLLFEGLRAYEVLKGFKVQSWDDADRYDQQNKKIVMLGKLLHQLKITLMKKDPEDLKKANHILNQFDQLKLLINQDSEIRNQSLHTRVREVHFRKKFVIAGSNHLLGILDDFKDKKCALIIPKISSIGKVKAIKLWHDIQNGVGYNEAYG